MAVPADDVKESKFVPPPKDTLAGTASSFESWAADLAAMAADPEIQSELRRIQAEFSVADMDGLGTS